jgi:hypothetical protein
LVLVGCYLVPAVASTPVTIATGTIQLPEELGRDPELPKYIEVDGCRGNYPSGYQVAIVNVANHRGETLEVEATGADTYMEDFVGLPHRSWSTLQVYQFDCTFPIEHQTADSVPAQTGKPAIIQNLKGPLLVIENPQISPTSWHINEHYKVTLVPR